jgi:hypothetical protein
MKPAHTPRQYLIWVNVTLNASGTPTYNYWSRGSIGWHGCGFSCYDSSSPCTSAS